MIREKYKFLAKKPIILLSIAFVTVEALIGIDILGIDGYDAKVITAAFLFIPFFSIVFLSAINYSSSDEKIEEAERKAYSTTPEEIKKTISIYIV